MRSCERTNSHFNTIPKSLIDMKPGAAGSPGKATRAKKNPACTHSRMVDYVYSKKGEKTGQLFCKECGAVLPDTPKEK